MSNRILTDEQFSNYTTVDGNRLDKALQDTEDLVNNTPDGLLGTRWMQSQIVMGWTPLAKLTMSGGAGFVTAAYRSQAPWLRFYNSDADKVGTGTVAHPFRVKGTGTTSHDWTLNTTDPWVAADTDKTIWVWTTKLYVTEPIIIDAIDLNMHTPDGANSVANFFFPPNLFQNAAATDHVTGNIQLTISVDDPGAPEQPIAQALELQIRDFDTGTARLNQIGALIASGTMSPTVDNPAAPGVLLGNPSGLELWIQSNNINKHIPANSRVVFTVALNGDKAVGAGEALDPQSYQRAMPNMVVTFLEGLK